MIKVYGFKNYNRINQFLKGKSAYDCKVKWQGRDKDQIFLSYRKWTTEEDLQLIYLKKMYGCKNITLFTKFIITRTYLEIKRRLIH